MVLALVAFGLGLLSSGFAGLALYKERGSRARERRTGRCCRCGAHFDFPGAQLLEDRDHGA
jgi:hypothetical protein